MKNTTKLPAKLQNKLKTLEKAKLPELRAEYAKIVGEATRSPNRTFLLRKIGEALAAAAAAKPARSTKAAARVTETAGTAETETTEMGAAAGSEPAEPKQRGRFTKLSVAELQLLYRELIGRQTGSTDKAYLVWKLREAEKGRIPLGPRTARPAADMSTLPLRIPTTGIPALDEVWRAQGVKSRNRFLLDAVCHYLTHLGAPAAAAAFAAPAIAEPAAAA